MSLVAFMTENNDFNIDPKKVGLAVGSKDGFYFKLEHFYTYMIDFQILAEA